MNPLKIIFYRILFCLVIFNSCNTVKVSKFSDYNRTEHKELEHYINDSLGFSIDFFGGHTYKTLPPKRARVPKYNKILLRRYLLSGSQLFYRSRSSPDPTSSRNYFGFDYYGYVSDKATSEVILETLHLKSKIYSTDIIKLKDKAVISYLIPLRQRTLFFICSKKFSQNSSFEIDSSILSDNTKKEFSTLREIR